MYKYIYRNIVYLSERLEKSFNCRDYFAGQLSTELSVSSGIEYRIDSIQVMNSHLHPSEYYIRRIHINYEYHGYCYPIGFPSSCDFFNCTLYHDQISSSEGTLIITLFYDQTENVDGPCGTLAQASVSLRPIGTG